VINGFQSSALSMFAVMPRLIAALKSVVKIGVSIYHHVT